MMSLHLEEDGHPMDGKESMRPKIMLLEHKWYDGWSFILCAYEMVKKTILDLNRVTKFLI